MSPIGVRTGPGTPSPPERRPLLEASGVRARYRRREVLRGVRLALRRGEIVGLSGENGSGKTTLLRVLAGLMRPSAGRIFRTASLGYAPQPPLVYDHLTVLEHFDYVAAARGLDGAAARERRGELLEALRFSDWSGARARELSEGTRQKLNLALALLADPEVLLLDEPYAGFERRTYLRFWDVARERRDRGRALLVVSHLFEDRERLDRLLQLEDGRLEDRTP